MKRINFLKINSSLLIAKFFLLLVLATHSHNLHAQEKVHNALLWKVTGNSLMKPSFLFGTIHLQDKRVFNFSDSLYSFLQRADGFAMEIHPDSVVTALLARADKTVKEKLLKRHLKKDDYEMLSRKLKKDLGIDADNLTVREAYMLKDYLAKPEARTDDMPTFVDAYLFGVARNQGKEIVGLEKAGDQVQMLDDLRGELDVREIVKGMKKEKNFTERLVQLYIREDLQAIHQMMSYLPDETEDKLLNMRNHVMVSRMDSLMQLKSFVVAVGTAHLPGDKGIIELLRRKGYTVEPVFTTSRTHANDYAVKAQQKTQWVDVKEPKLGYSARMPAKPSPMDMLNGSTKMNMYMDLTSMKLYYTGFIIPALSVTPQNADSILKKMCTNAMASSKGKPISSKRFKKDRFEGIDFVYRQMADNMHVRLQVMAMGKRVYLVCFGAPNLEELESKDAKDFFASFKIEDMPLQSWQVHTFKDHYFSISLPDAPKIVPQAVTDSSVYSVQVSSMDNVKGAYYGLTIVTAAPGYLIPDDSVYFSSTVTRLQENIDMLDMKQKDTLFHGFNARLVKAELKDSLLLQAYIISRGSRIYTLLTVNNQNDASAPEVQAFFDSFAFVDYPQLQWKEKKNEEHAFTVPLAGQFFRVKYLDELTDSAVARRDFICTAYDSASAVSFFITRTKLSPYLWAKHDSVLLLKYMKELTDENETIADYRLIRNGNSNGLEFNIVKRNSTLRQRVRMLLNGDAIYLLQADAPGDHWKQYDYGRMMEDFRFTKEEKPTFLYTNSFEKWLNALRSTDSLTHMRAYGALEYIIVDSTNLQQLLTAACNEYPIDTAGYVYHTVCDKMLELAASLKYSRFNELLEAHYNSLKPQQEQFKYELLGALAGSGNRASMETVQRLMEKGLPLKGDPYALTSHFYDSLQLTKLLYPWLLSQTFDTLISLPLFGLHKQMLDSNYISFNDLKPYHQQLLQGARNELAAIAREKDDDHYSPGYYEMTKILAGLESDSADVLLRQFMNSRFIMVKYYAATALMEKKKNVPPAILLTLAADTGYRVSLYNEMVRLKIEKQYPVKYMNRRAFADSYMYNGVDDPPERIQFVGERTVVFKGKKQKFFLYKLMYGEGDEGSYLGICGAFDTDTKSFIAAENITGFYGEETFKQSLIDKHLKAYLAYFEED
jgi:uncharacterized protein YbaP (TraB family)